MEQQKNTLKFPFAHTLEKNLKADLTDSAHYLHRNGVIMKCPFSNMQYEGSNSHHCGISCPHFSLKPETKQKPTADNKTMTELTGRMLAVLSCGKGTNIVMDGLKIEVKENNTTGLKIQK